MQEQIGMQGQNIQRGHIRDRVHSKQIDRKKYMQKSLNEGGNMCEGNLMKGKFMQRSFDEGEINPKKFKME